MNNELNFSDLMEHFGGHEQNILYSYFIVTKDTSMSMGKDYFISLVQILPSFISDPLVGSNRVNEVISSIASPEHFIENNLNLGAFFIVEAYLNFSWFGVFFLPVIFMYLIYLFDKKSYKDRFILSSTIPFFIYYGFGFGLKIIFYVVVFDYLFRKLLKGNKVE
ncbi:O-antigen polysaccharide polymerase Wzy [Pseudoalteromonas sp. H100]|nr:O-antigen polysaccharide polymerase Wzy [Pseudoalteromonas sp. H100]WFO19458.1 O-antigen polysaccharide polymerase Wzy [Pseudoalteromonas sp. H100]